MKLFSTKTKAAPASAMPDRSAVVFVLALALAAMAALGWKEVDSLQHARSAVRSELQMQSLSLASVFETAFESAEQTLYGVANQLEYNAGRPANTLNLRKHSLRSPSLEDLRYYRADQHLGERASLTPLPSDTLPEWVQKQARQGHITGFGRDGNGLAFYRLAQGPQGQLLGTVYATLSANYFQTVTSQSMLSNAMASCLMGPDGEVMLDFGDQGGSCLPGNALEPMRPLDTQFGNFGSRAQEADGQLVVVQQLRNHPLRVVLIASGSLAQARWMRGARASLAALLLIGMAAFLFLLYLKRAAQTRRLAKKSLEQAKAHLQASHDLLDRLSLHVPGVLYQYRRYPDGRSTFPYASQGLSEIFAVEPAAAAMDASPVFDRVYGEDLEALAASTRVSMQTLSTWQHEFRVKHRLGGLRWLSGLANPMPLDDGSVLWHGVIKDVTERKQLEQSIYEHGRDLNTILENSSVGIVFVKQRRLVWANTRMAEMFGYSLPDLQGQSTQILYPTSQGFDAMGASGYAALARGERHIAEQPMRHRQGHLVWMRLSGKAVDGANLDTGSIWVFEDVTEQKQLESKLQLAASVFTSAKEGILITDAAGTIVDVNATFSHITGYSREEALGRNPRILNSGLQAPEFYQALWHSLNTKGYWYGEVWNRRKSGDVYAQMLTISSVRNADGAVQNHVALFSDITPIKEHQRQLEHIAHYDALTALPNRLLLADRLHQAIVQSQRRKLCLAVVFLDLDGFKAINDSHGHAAGDALLIALAQRMHSALREGDTLARIGGDEFVAVLADLEQAQDCEPILARLLQTASDPVRLGDLELRVSASMGVTLYPQDGADVDLLMRQADQAMYAAKQSGKNRYHLFDVTQDAALRQQRDSLERMQQALDLGQFELFYQPKVNMRNGRVVGAEALIRWNHPQRGFLYPGDFLPVMENHPLSIALGEWVIRTALAQIGRWQGDGLFLPVSINISAMQLQQNAFPARLQQLLAAFADVHPAQLELEVLETSDFEDLARVHGIITECQAMGIRFALDDFGTGYSSLTYLKHLPVETLKIDQSFVRDMLEDANDLAIVNGIIGLARAFGRQVVAEGVETDAHRDLLLSIGCELAQGYGIAKPMAADCLAAWVAQWQASPGGAYLHYPATPP